MVRPAAKATLLRGETRWVGEADASRAGLAGESPAAVIAGEPRSRLEGSVVPEMAGESRLAGRDPALVTLVRGGLGEGMP